jgi:hypothetical protein
MPTRLLSWPITTRTGLLLRASLRTAGERNDIDEAAIARTFGAWRIEDMERAEVPSDTHTLEVIVARLSAGRVR